MKNKIIFYTLLILFALFGLQIPVFADDDTSNKVIVEALQNITLSEKELVELKVLNENKFSNGILFEKDSILSAKIARIVDPKRGKRNGYIIVEPIQYTVPSKNQTLEINDEYWMAKVVDYKPLDVKNAAISAGLTVGSLFVKGLSQVYYFGKGVLNPEDGNDRFSSGIKNVYKNSPLVYIEEGEEVNIEKGDVLLLKFYNEDVPKWKIRERNQ